MSSIPLTSSLLDRRCSNSSLNTVAHQQMHKSLNDLHFAPVTSATKQTEIKWKPMRQRIEMPKDFEAFKTEMLKRHALLLLNKMTEETFKELSHEFINLLDRVDTEERICLVVDVLLRKAFDESIFSDMYAQLCRCIKLHYWDLERYVQEEAETGISDCKPKLRPFVYYLIKGCQAYFDSVEPVELMDSRELADLRNFHSQGGRNRQIGYLEEEQNKVKRRNLGIMQFTAELYKCEILTKFVAYMCVKRLLWRAEKGDEYYTECLCKFLTTAGEKLLNDGDIRIDPKKIVTKQMVLADFDALDHLLKQKKCCKRVQFEIQNLMELKHNNWKPRRSTIGLKNLNNLCKKPLLKTASVKSSLSADMAVPSLFETARAENEVAQSKLPVYDTNEDEFEVINLQK